MNSSVGIVRWIACALVMMVALQALPAMATSWADLSEGQRRVLAEFDGRFDSLPPERRVKLARGAELAGTAAGQATSAVAPNGTVPAPDT